MATSTPEAFWVVQLSVTDVVPGHGAGLGDAPKSTMTAFGGRGVVVVVVVGGTVVVVVVVEDVVVVDVDVVVVDELVVVVVDAPFLSLLVASNTTSTATRMPTRPRPHQIRMRRPAASSPPAPPA